MIRRYIDNIRSAFPGSTDSRFERTLGFGEGALVAIYERNRTNKVNTALLRVVSSAPFLVEVAECGYDAIVSKHFESMWVSEQLLKALR